MVEIAILGMKNRLLFVIFLNAQLMIGTGKVQLAKLFYLAQSV